MSKIFGLKKDFVPVREDRSRIIVSFELQDVDEVHGTWHEVYFYKKRHPQVSVQEMREAVENAINGETDEKILTGFVWNGKPVWLSDENQRNFSEGQRAAMITNGESLPMTFKLGEDAQKNPVYHEFTDVEELTGFYLQSVDYVNQCLKDGWRRKDAIDWKNYNSNT